MWLFCGGMYRSGSTLQFQIASEIVENKLIGKRIEWTKPDRFFEIKSKYKNYHKYKVYKSHLLTVEIDKEFINNNALGIYIYRDLRDVAISLMQKNNVSFEQVIKEKTLDRAIEEYTKWTSKKNVHVARYEDVINNLAQEISNIATFLKVENMSLEQCAILANEFSLEKQQKRIETSINSNNLINQKNNRFCPTSLLHTNHIKDGAVGKWKNLLEENQYNYFIEHYGWFLKKTGYLF